MKRLATESKAATSGPVPDPLSPTSDLAFASRHCDVPYLDACEGGTLIAIEAMRQRVGNSPTLDFVEQCNEHNLKIGRWVELLKTIEDHLKWAHRGGSPAGLNANVCFSRARDMLSLVTGSLELMTIDAACDLEYFCESIPVPGVT